jgi:hypothetical protein
MGTNFMKIVNEYGAVLEDEKDSGVLCRESKLPYSIAEIKSAIFEALKAVDPSDSKSRNALETGYISLASFVSDKDAEVGKRFMSHSTKALELQPTKDTGDREKFQKYVHETKDDLEKFHLINKRVSVKTSEYLNELREQQW